MSSKNRKKLHSIRLRLLAAVFPLNETCVRCVSRISVDLTAVTNDATERNEIIVFREPKTRVLRYSKGTAIRLRATTAGVIVAALGYNRFSAACHKFACIVL